MDTTTPRTLGISRDLRISREILKLRKTFGKEIEERLKISNIKISYFFERAFIRWIFNTVRLGINPFRDLVSANDFVLVDDVEYFSKKYGYGDQFRSFSWKWLSDKFKAIHGTNAIPCGVTTRSISDQKVTLTYKWSKTDVVSYTIPTPMYTRMSKLYTGDEDMKDDHILLLVSRYDACGTTNNHCSMPPDLVSFCDITTEMFGSPLNTCAAQFCSPFPDIETYFGSLGSFFNPKLEFSTGVYLMNPPYDEDIITAAVQKVIVGLKSKAELTIVVILPVWDPESQKAIEGKANFGKQFKALDLLNSSGYVRSRMILNFATYPFFDYYLHTYVKVTDTHLIILSNTNCELNVVDISHQWSKLSAN
jgi:hypothetical protein